MEGESEEECLGFVEPKSNKGRRNTFHIENIEGCAALKDEPFAEDVLRPSIAQNHTLVYNVPKESTTWPGCAHLPGEARSPRLLPEY